MKKMFRKINGSGITLGAACGLAIITLALGCSTDPNKKTVRVFQAAGSGRKVGLVQDPVTGQYSLGYQSVILAGMIVPITITTTSNGVVATCPDAVMSYEVGAKPYFFGSAECTITCATGANAVQTLLGGQHVPINEPYWTNSATGLASSLPLNSTVTPTVTSTITTTNGSVSATTPIVIKP
jgi:hypothetical protein